MKFTKDMKDLTAKYSKAIAEANLKVMGLENDEMSRGSKIHDEAVAKAKADLEAIKRRAISELEGRQASFKDEIRLRYLPKGEELTPDAEIFKTAIKLSKAELIAYMEKYKDNMSMTRLIIDYAKKNEIELVGSYKYAINREDKLIGSDKLLTYCKTALTDTMYMTDLIENETNYQRICGEALADD